MRTWPSLATLTELAPPSLSVWLLRRKQHAQSREIDIKTDCSRHSPVALHRHSPQLDVRSLLSPAHHSVLSPSSAAPSSLNLSVFLMVRRSVVVIQPGSSVGSSASRTSYAPTANSPSSYTSSSASVYSSRYSSSPGSEQSYSMGRNETEYYPDETSYYEDAANFDSLRSPTADNYRVPISRVGNTVLVQHNAGNLSQDGATSTSAANRNYYHQSKARHR